MNSDLDSNKIITLYTEDNLGIEAIAKEFHVGKKKIREILEANNIEIKKKGGQLTKKDNFVLSDWNEDKYPHIDGYHYIAVDKISGFTSSDIKNKGGILTTRIRNEYNIDIPSLYYRRMYYMRTGNYWWEQWFDVIKVEDRKVKHCPYCDWVTIDLENRSGMFETHLKKYHNISKKEYISEHPEDKSYFYTVNKTNQIQMDTNSDNYVVCKICGKKLTRITTNHLNKHNITKNEYIKKYGIFGMISSNSHKKQSIASIKTNQNMTPTVHSKDEKEIMDFIKSIGIDCYTDRKTLNGRELDILVPSKNIAFEYDGNVWHCERFGKDKNYHLNKTIECFNKGIRLIHIFEDEYVLHKDIVLSKIRHILGCDEKSEKIPGRKCTVREILSSEAELFLNKNHIQGFVNSTVYIGAFYNEELIGVMSFLNEGDGKWNLTRFASKNGAICQGVGGKMFKHFTKNYDFIEIKSFLDRRWCFNETENIYTKLGFEFSEYLKPDYRYYNSSHDKYIRFHKFGFRKQKLHKKYGFPLTMTEKEMTKKLGYDRIWDCGLIKYVYVNNDL